MTHNVEDVPTFERVTSLLRELRSKAVEPDRLNYGKAQEMTVAEALNAALNAFQKAGQSPGKDEFFDVVFGLASTGSCETLKASNRDSNTQLQLKETMSLSDIVGQLGKLSTKVIVSQQQEIYCLRLIVKELLNAILIESSHGGKRSSSTSNDTFNSESTDSDRLNQISTENGGKRLALPSQEINDRRNKQPDDDPVQNQSTESDPQRPFIFEDEGESTVVEREQKSRRLVMLMTSTPINRAQRAMQERSLVVLESNGIQPDFVDGADRQMMDIRNTLFDVSGLVGNYPQFFLVEEDGMTEFFGDFETIERLNDQGKLTGVFLHSSSTTASSPTGQTTNRQMNRKNSTFGIEQGGVEKTLEWV